MLDASNHINVVPIDEAASFGASAMEGPGANASGNIPAAAESNAAAHDSQKTFEQLSGKMPDVALTTTDQFRIAEEIMDLDLGDGSASGNCRRTPTTIGSASGTQSRLNASAYHRQLSHPRNE